MTEQEEKRMRMAKAFFNDPAVQEVKAEMESTLKEQWMLAETSAKRENIFDQLRALGDMFALLESWTFEGEIAARTARRLAH